MNLEYNRNNTNRKNIEEKKETRTSNELNGQGVGLELEDLIIYLFI